MVLFPNVICIIDLTMVTIKIIRQLKVLFKLPLIKGLCISRMVLAKYWGFF